MGRYVIRRILQFIPVFLIATFGIFYLVFALPGDPIRALAGEKRPTNAQVAALEAKYNVNDPILVQYGKFLGVTRDDDIRCAANDEERALVNRGEMDDGLEYEIELNGRRIAGGRVTPQDVLGAPGRFSIDPDRIRDGRNEIRILKKSAYIRTAHRHLITTINRIGKRVINWIICDYWTRNVNIRFRCIQND